MNRIIYPKPEGGIAVVCPTGEIPFEEVCRKDVPAGTPYLVIGPNDLPPDYVFRDAWEADFSNPDGHGIGDQAWFIEKAAAEQAVNVIAEEVSE